MTCRDYEELLSADLDGELEAARAADLALHLSDCVSCRKVQEDFRVNRLLVHAMAPRSAPRDAWKKLESRLDTAVVPPLPDNVMTLPQRRAFSPRRWMRGLQAAACVAVVFLSTLLYLGYTDPDWNSSNAPALGTVNKVSANSLIRGHALLQATNPFADHCAWQYVASESDLNAAPLAPENESFNKANVMVQEDVR